MCGHSEIKSVRILEPEQSNQRPSWHYYLCQMIPILAVYIFLALYRIDHQGLWVDETLSVRVADPNGSILNKRIWFKGHGPFYFALLHFWGKLSTSEAVLRSLSILIGCIAVFVTYAMGLKLFNRRVAWIGTTLFATSPFVVWYSQEVRYISLMIAASLFTMYTFDRALSENRRRLWLLYCCSLIFAIAAFVSNFFLVVVQWLSFLRSSSRRQVWRKVLVCQVLVFVLFIWWANGGRYQELGGYWKKLFGHIAVNSEKSSSLPRFKNLSSVGDREFELAALPYTFFAFSTGFSIGPSVRDLQVQRSMTTLRPYVPLLLTLGVLFGGLFVSGLVALWSRPQTGMYLTAWLAVPIIGALGVSALTNMAYNVRYVAMSFPAYIFILTAGITSFRRRLVQITLLVCVLLVNGYSLGNYYFNPRYAREDYRNAAKYLESVASPQDIIMVLGSTYALRYYYKGEVPVVGWDKEFSGDQSAITRRLKELHKGYDHLWLAVIRPWHTDPGGKVKAALDEAHEIVERKQFPGVDIYSYQLNPPRS